MTPKQLNNIITQIAQHQLGLETLETRHSDGLDFHEISVWRIKDALEAAFEAGRQDGLKSQPKA